MRVCDRSGGFGEGGDPAGRALGERLQVAIKASGLAVSGPNCLGNLASCATLLTIPDERITNARPGPCASAPGWSYQAALLREDL